MVCDKFSSARLGCSVTYTSEKSTRRTKQACNLNVALSLVCVGNSSFCRAGNARLISNVVCSDQIMMVNRRRVGVHGCYFDSSCSSQCLQRLPFVVIGFSYLEHSQRFSCCELCSSCDGLHSFGLRPIVKRSHTFMIA